MKTSTPIVLLVLFSILPSTNVSSENTVELKWGAIHASTNQSGSQIEIIQATPVFGRYLASVKLLPKDTNETKSWLHVYGHAKKFAPAWFTKEWALINVGEGIYGLEALFTPVPSDISMAEIDTIPSGNFPQVIVRDPVSIDCPFLYGLPAEIACLDQELQIETNKDGSKKRWPIPVQVRGYLTLNGDVWFKGLRNGFLLHRFDVENGQIADSVLRLDDVTRILNKKFRRTELSDLVSEKALIPKTNESQQEALEPQAPKKAASDYRELLSIPSSFQYDVAIQNSTAYLILRRPLSVIVLSWPECKIHNVIVIRKDNLPAWAHLYNQLFVYGIGIWKGTAVAWFSVSVPVTYGSMMLTDPKQAQLVKENWKRQTPLTPDVVLGLDEDIFGIGFNSQAMTNTYKIKTDSDEDWHRLFGIFHAGEKELWIPVFNQKARQYGVVQLN